MRQSRAILVEYVQEMRADLFNLTIGFKIFVK